ncbi:MAG: 5-oxoprolinase subunit PxpB [Alphaproteobacteria bacterium]|nr:5-oxoprolinase subunit PxpB [Alphaproteobacteria bacterium]
MSSPIRSQAIPQPRVLSCGDTAISFEFGDRIDRDLSLAAVTLGRRIDAAGLEGVIETVPTYRSVLVHYSPLETSSADLVSRILSLADSGGAEPERARLWRIPACYEPALAPDLDDVAARTGLSTSEVVARHTGARYHVYMLGFLPGYPYMGDLCPELRLPRREDPRVKVPPGSVAIATEMTAVYTYQSPGGWHLIGRTPVPLFDVAARPPAVLQPGDQVMFEAVSRAEHDRLAAAVARGEFDLPSEPAMPHEPSGPAGAAADRETTP